MDCSPSLDILPLLTQRNVFRKQSQMAIESARIVITRPVTFPFRVIYCSRWTFMSLPTGKKKPLRAWRHANETQGGSQILPENFFESFRLLVVVER